MPFYSGQQGELWIDEVKAAKAQNWSFQTSQAVLETTSLGDTDRTIVPGVRSISGSCRLFYYQESPGSGGDVTRLIQKCVKTPGGGTANVGQGRAPESSPATLVLLIKDGSTYGKHIRFRCYLTSISMSMAVGEVFSADVSFEVDGAPSELDI